MNNAFLPKPVNPANFALLVHSGRAFSFGISRVRIVREQNRGRTSYTQLNKEIVMDILVGAGVYAAGAFAAWWLTKWFMEPAVAGPAIDRRWQETRARVRETLDHRTQRNGHIKDFARERRLSR